MALNPLRGTGGQVGGASVRLDTREFDAMLNDMEHKLPHIIAKTLSKILSEAQFETRAYIEQRGDGRQSHISDAGSRVAEMFNRKDVFVRGSEILSGMIAERAFTSPDDDGNRFDLSEALQDGIRERNVYFRSTGAALKGRQFGRRGSNTPWTMSNPGRFYFHGYPKLSYIEFGMGIVERRLERRIGAAIEREFGPGSYYRG